MIQDQCELNHYSRGYLPRVFEARLSTPQAANLLHHNGRYRRLAGVVRLCPPNTMVVYQRPSVELYLKIG